MDPTFKQQLRLLKRWCFLRFSGSCHISIMVSCKSRCTPLRCSAAYQTPLKSCTRGSCFWGFFPQHTPYATGRWDGAQITVAASLLHGLSSSRIGITNIKILDWVQYSELFFTSPIFQPQGKIPAGFTSTMRKPRSSRFTLKFNLKCKPKSYWGKKKKKKKHNATEYSLLEENKQINKKSTAQLHAARPGPPLHTRTRGAFHQRLLSPCARAEPRGPLHLSHLCSRTSQRQTKQPLRCPKDKTLLLAFNPPRSYHHQVKQNWLLIRKLLR